MPLKAPTVPRSTSCPNNVFLFFFLSVILYINQKLTNFLGLKKSNKKECVCLVVNRFTDIF